MNLSRILRFVPAVGIVIMVLASLAAIRVPSQPAYRAPDAKRVGSTAAYDSGIAPALRISIPYGIDRKAYPSEDGRELLVGGHGGCGPGGTYDVEVMVMQEQGDTTAEATGFMEAPCEPYVSWETTATAKAYSPPFIDGAAEVCAVAHNYDGETGEIIDEQEWCEPAIIGPYQRYLPAVLRLPSD